MKSLTVSKDLFMIDEAILSKLKHLDLTGCILEMSAEAKGQGAYSEVFKGRAHIPGRGEIEVAIKRLRFHVKTTDCKRLFEQEIYVWSKFKHPNLLPLLGYAFCSDTGYPLLISEWMHNGTAWDYVQRKPDLSIFSLRRMIVDIAQGLAYLAEEGVIHSDLKAENVLITPNGKAMINDFGCSRITHASQSIARDSTTMKGTIHFWAPELMGGSKQTTKSDVWAFGMTIYELLTRTRPYNCFNEVHVIIRITMGDLPTFSSEKQIDNSQARLRKELEAICKKCWILQPDLRPSVDELLQEDVLKTVPLLGDLPWALNSGPYDTPASVDSHEIALHSSIDPSDAEYGEILEERDVSKCSRPRESRATGMKRRTRRRCFKCHTIRSSSAWRRSLCSIGKDVCSKCSLHDHLTYRPRPQRIQASNKKHLPHIVECLDEEEEVQHEDWMEIDLTNIPMLPSTSGIGQTTEPSGAVIVPEQESQISFGVSRPSATICRSLFTIFALDTSIF